MEIGAFTRAELVECTEAPELISAAETNAFNSTQFKNTNGRLFITYFRG